MENKSTNKTFENLVETTSTLKKKNNTSLKTVSKISLV